MHHLIFRPIKYALSERVIIMKKLLARVARLHWSVALVILMGLLMLGTPQPSEAQDDVGYQDFVYSTCSGSVTGEKPESKIWWNDGYWWGSLCNASGSGYFIHRMDPAVQSWVNTGVAIDNRTSSNADALWDNKTQKLYIVSHVFTNAGSATSTVSQWGRLYRYSYNATSDTYSLDAGFPVTVTRGKSETLVIAKDTVGRLWVAYVEDSKVMVNVTAGNDAVWGTPFQLPGSAGFPPNSDDIASIIALPSNQIGVMWSSQRSDSFYYAVHNDSDTVNTWKPIETALSGNNISDDHLNMKVDSTGRLYVAAKTSLTGSSAMVILLVRQTNGQWSNHTFGLATDGHTRPIVQLHEATNRLYMFAASPNSGGRIYYKSSDMTNISFVLGVGEVIISSSVSTRINNVSSTKQNLDVLPGLLIIANDGDTNTYFHNYLVFGSPTPSPTPTNTFTPTNTPTPSNTPTATNTPSQRTRQRRRRRQVIHPR